MKFTCLLINVGKTKKGLARRVVIFALAGEARCVGGWGSGFFWHDLLERSHKGGNRTGSGSGMTWTRQTQGREYNQAGQTFSCIIHMPYDTTQYDTNFDHALRES